MLRPGRAPVRYIVSIKPAGGASVASTTAVPDAEGGGRRRQRAAVQENLALVFLCERPLAKAPAGVGRPRPRPRRRRARTRARAPRAPRSRRRRPHAPRRRARRAIAPAPVTAGRALWRRRPRCSARTCARAHSVSSHLTSGKWQAHDTNRLGSGRKYSTVLGMHLKLSLPAGDHVGGFVRGARAGAAWLGHATSRQADALRPSTRQPSSPASPPPRSVSSTRSASMILARGAARSRSRAGSPPRRARRGRARRRRRPPRRCARRAARRRAPRSRSRRRGARAAARPRRAGARTFASDGGLGEAIAAELEEEEERRRPERRGAFAGAAARGDSRPHAATLASSAAQRNGGAVHAHAASQHARRRLLLSAFACISVSMPESLTPFPYKRGVAPAAAASQ